MLAVDDWKNLDFWNRLVIGVFFDVVLEPKLSLFRFLERTMDCLWLTVGSWNSSRKCW